MRSVLAGDSDRKGLDLDQGCGPQTPAGGLVNHLCPFDLGVGESPLHGWSPDEVVREGASGARGIMRDITEAKALEARLRSQTRAVEEANEKLRELNRIKADFTAMLVHDLKTPISTMIMALQLLKDVLTDEHSSDLHTMIEGGLASGRSTVKIVEDMLELFRFDSTEVTLA